MNPLRLLPLLLLCAIILSACAGGPPKDYYNPAIADPPKFKGPLSIEIVPDLEAAKAKCLADGYVIIGTSVYGGDQPKRVELEAQAKRVHATKVIYHLDPPGQGSWKFHVGLWAGGGSGGYGVEIVYLGK